MRSAASFRSDRRLLGRLSGLARSASSWVGAWWPFTLATPPAGALWVSRSAAGPAVSEHLALSLPVVYACVSIIADTLAGLRWDLVRRGRDAQGRPTVERLDLAAPGAAASLVPVAGLLADPAQGAMPACDVWRTIAAHVLLWGNAFAEIERTAPGGEPVKLWILPPDSVRPDVSQETRRREIVRYRSMAVVGAEGTIAPSDMLHWRAMSTDGIWGLSPIQVLRDAVGLGLALQEYGSRYFREDCKSGGVIMHPGKLSPEALKNIQASFGSGEGGQGGLERAHRVKVVEEGMKWMATTVPPEDAQFLGTREFQVSELASIYRVPPVLIGQLDKTSSWGTGIEQIMIGFIAWTIAPHADRLGQELTQKLLSLADREMGWRIEADLQPMLAADMQGRATYYARGILDGWLTRNEARAREGLQPLPGLDVPLAPLNMGHTGQGEADDAE